MTKKIILIGAFFCGINNLSAQIKNEVVTRKINMPKANAESLIKNKSASTISVVLNHTDKIYCYTSKDSLKGNFYSLEGTNSFRDFLTQQKNKFGQRISVIIYVGNPSYKLTIDVLDEMSINHISNYVLINNKQN